MEKKICKRCSKDFLKGTSTQYNWDRKEYCSRTCKNRTLASRNKKYSYIKKGYNPNSLQFGQKNGQWKGGRIIDYQGYIRIKEYNHPWACQGYVKEHIINMERNIGRLIRPGVVVHHLDGNRINNQINNLHLFNSKSEHTKYHNDLRGLVREALKLEV